MTWFEVVAPLMVIGLLGMILYFITSSTGMSRRNGRSGPFPPTQRDVAATARRWRRRARHVLPDQPTPHPPDATGCKLLCPSECSTSSIPSRHSFSPFLLPQREWMATSTSLTLSLCLADSAKWQTHTIAPSLGEAVARDTGHCPETSRGANGQNRQGRNDGFAQSGWGLVPLTRRSAKTPLGGVATHAVSNLGSASSRLPVVSHGGVFRARHAERGQPCRSSMQVPLCRSSMQVLYAGHHVARNVLRRQAPWSLFRPGAASGERGARCALQERDG